jgi:predicted nucleic acid-binding protein
LGKSLEALLDTNVLVAVLVEDDVNHREALRVWSGAEKVHVPFISVVELEYFLVKHKLGSKAIQELVNDPKVEIVPNTSQDIRFALTRKPKSYDDFNDYIILSTARRTSLPLLTFDGELRRLAKS